MLDPSLLVAIWTGEAAAVPLQAWVARHERNFIVSDFAKGEFASALAMKVRLRVLSPEPARAVLDDFAAWAATRPIELISSDDIAAATEMVLRVETRLRLPDAIHVATARRLGAALVSLDKRQVAAAQALGIAAIDPLS